MEDLLDGKVFYTRIDEQIVFSQLDCSEEAIWSLLLASRYLRVEACAPIRSGDGPTQNTAWR